MVMDVLYSINGNGKLIRKSSLYMVMIMKMLWNGYVDMLLQFYVVSVVMWWRFMSLPVMFDSYDYIYKKDKSIRETKLKGHIVLQHMVKNNRVKENLVNYKKQEPKKIKEKHTVTKK